MAIFDKWQDHILWRVQEKIQTFAIWYILFSICSLFWACIMLVLPWGNLWYYYVWWCILYPMDLLHIHKPSCSLLFPLILERCLPSPALFWYLIGFQSRGLWSVRVLFHISLMILPELIQASSELTNTCSFAPLTICLLSIVPFTMAH